MSKRRNTDEEKRPLGEYVQAKLGITLAQFIIDEGVKRQTVYNRWKRPEGRKSIMDAVDCIIESRKKTKQRGKKDGIQSS